MVSESIITKILTNEDITEHLYEKTIKCPICGQESKNLTVKKGAYRIINKDSDLMVNYSGVNPMFYEVVYCKECGYTALPAYFDAINDNEKNLIRDKIASKWVPTQYPKQFNIDFTIKQFKLALLNCMAKEGRASESGYICLKLSWLYRLTNDIINEKRFQIQALTCFEKTYTNEKFPVFGLDEWSLLYLIGELNKRLGDNEKALSYFSRVLMSTLATQKIKEKTREQRDLIREV